MRKIIITALTAVSAFFIIQSCSKSGSSPNGGGGDKGNSFDRKAMLTNWETNIILPAYTQYVSVTANLDAAVTAFNTAPDAAKLTALQTAFKSAYEQWQSASAFDFGPAETATFRANTNTFPTNVSQINNNIKDDVYNPNLLVNLSAKGFPAIDYLLFGVGADNTAVLAQYTTDALAANRKKNLAALSAELKTNAASILSAWNGAYKTTFLNADGTDVGSSTGQLVNQLIQDYENLKNQEIGIPAGIQSLGTTFPTKVQAYYSKESVKLALLHIAAVQNIYLGKSAVGDGLGLDDYLIKANATYTDGKPLNDAIKAQFTTSIAKLNVLTDPLSDNIKNNNAQVTAAYAELQKLTVLLKTDMTSKLGIAITFGDNDGD
ncbi:imelysin family protein [Mucilaginibacter sp. CAU 1740]|uniref:imelysin family protein n=1 Tax=Mucilaginibacter sp. CAU 1740 TaxID=3140365 RepID=UPI00325AA35E